MKNAIVNGIVAGFMAGILLGLLIVFFVTPLILTAEVYEKGSPVVVAQGNHDLSHRHSNEKENLISRNLFTILGTSFLSVAYGAGLSLIYFFMKNKGFKTGLTLGFLGFLFLNFLPCLPGFGSMLQPPGVEAKSSLEIRQSWWIMMMIVEIIAICSFFAVKKFFSSKGVTLSNAVALISSLIILSIPYIIGAPSEILESKVPVSLSRNFTFASLGSFFLYWLALGVLVVFWNQKKN